jgi:EmrB/QacA subfamily drug resistance transporter
MTKQQRLVLLVAILASFVAFLDGSVVNVALPAISRDLGGGLSAQPWIVDGYMLTLGTLILIAGSLSDLFGRKRILKLGLIGFGVASVLCALAPSSGALVGARMLQGVAGALLVPSSLAIIMASFDGEAKGRAIGSWTAWTGISFVIGPLLGGFLVDAASWRWIFAINVLPIAVTLALLTRLDQPEQIRENTKVDYVGALLCTFGLGAFVYALIEQTRYGWTNPLILVPLVAGPLLLAAFIVWERHYSSAMLPLSVFRNRNFSVGNVATAAIYGALALATFIIGIFLQQVGGYSAFHAGLALLPVTVVMFFLSPRFGALAGKYGARLFMTAGPLLAALGFLLMLRIGAHVQYWTELFPGVLLFALGLSATVAPLTSAILSNVETKHSGVASAVNNAVSRIAGLITVACIGLFAGSHLDVAGFHRTLLAVAGLMLVGSVISAIGIQNPSRETAA